MSHSHDATLLQRMGFRDPDRGSSRHDVACAALAAHPDDLLSLDLRLEVKDITVRLEVPLQKGSGQYASTIGFIDAFVEWSELGEHVSCRVRPDHDDLCPNCVVGRYWSRKSMLVEVKTKIDSLGDLLRQMNLYREYKRADEYFVWSLDSGDIGHAALLRGQGYRLFCSEQLPRWNYQLGGLR